MKGYAKLQECSCLKIASEGSEPCFDPRMRKARKKSREAREEWSPAIGVEGGGAVLWMVGCDAGREESRAGKVRRCRNSREQI
jgi:hypothetical protein